MAACNKFVTQNASSVAVDKDVAARFCGAPVKKAVFSFEKAAADISGSIWRVARFSPFVKILSVTLACDALTGFTDLDIGFYKPLDVGGNVIDADCLKDGLDPHAGLSTQTSEFAVGIADVGKEAYLIAGVAATAAQHYGAFDVAITGNTAGTDVGTIAGVIEYIE